MPWQGDFVLSALQAPVSFTQAADAVDYLLERYGSQLADMPPLQYSQALATLTGGVYAGLFEDVPVNRAQGDSPLSRLYRGVSRVIPATRVDAVHDRETAAVRVFQRLMERQASLGWRMVHPQVDSGLAMPLTKRLIQGAFALQDSFGRADRAMYPVIFTLDYPVVCLLQSMYLGLNQELRQQTFVSVVSAGFLRLTVMPWYMLGYDGYDSLVWLHKGFRVRVGGFQLPVSATALHELAWQLTDYRLERRVAYNPATGAVMKHSARVLTR